MSHDPILSDLNIYFRRFLLFIFLSVVQAIALWIWFWMQFEHWAFIQTIRYLANAWPFSLDVFASVVAMASLWIGFANSSIAFLLIGRFWGKSAEVLHLRGSRIVDGREGA